MQENLKRKIRVLKAPPLHGRQLQMRTSTNLIVVRVHEEQILAARVEPTPWARADELGAADVVDEGRLGDEHGGRDLADGSRRKSLPGLERGRRHVAHGHPDPSSSVDLRCNSVEILIMGGKLSLGQLQFWRTTS